MAINRDGHLHSIGILFVYLFIRLVTGKAQSDVTVNGKQGTTQLGNLNMQMNLVYISLNSK